MNFFERFPHNYDSIQWIWNISKTFHWSLQILVNFLLSPLKNHNFCLAAEPQSPKIPKKKGSIQAALTTIYVSFSEDNWECRAGLSGSVLSSDHSAAEEWPLSCDWGFLSGQRHDYSIGKLSWCKMCTLQSDWFSLLPVERTWSAMINPCMLSAWQRITICIAKGLES